MKQKPAGKKENPYKVLYWMGGALLVLALGVVALIMLLPNQGGPYDPERTVIWVYDEADPAGPAQVTLVEESTSAGSLSAINFPAPAGALEVGGAKKPSRAQDYLTEQIGRQIHHRVFMPYSVVATLIDAAGGIDVAGGRVTGVQAITYIKEGDDQTAPRATQVLLALSQAVYERGVNLGTGEALSLARSLDTDLDLLAMPDVLGRWAGYGTPALHSDPGTDLKALQQYLKPDPVAPAA